MKKVYLLTLCASLFLATRESEGVTFVGQIHSTVLYSDPPGNDYEDYFWDGRTFIGTYSYESPTVDGTFTPASGNLKISNLLGFLDEKDDADRYPFGPVLVVSGGKVVHFHFEVDDGFTTIFATSWNYDDVVVGTGFLTDPRRLAVPDSGGTLLLGLVALGSVVAARRV